MPGTHGKRKRPMALAADQFRLGKKEMPSKNARETEELKRKQPLFIAAGKPYDDQLQLMERRLDEKEHVYEDCYGRMVLRIDERYPTFDCFDALYEHRYFHYYYIQTEMGFTCVRTADDQPEIYVRGPMATEDFIREKSTWHHALLEAAGLTENQ